MKFLASATAATICCWVAVRPSGAAGGIGGRNWLCAKAGAALATSQNDKHQAEFEHACFPVLP